jgi:hypothetical protein
MPPPFWGWVLDYKANNFFDCNGLMLSDNLLKG